jgi:hypothetical protein
MIEGGEPKPRQPSLPRKNVRGGNVQIGNSVQGDRNKDRVVYIRCICGIVGKKITNYTVLYGVCIRFWPTLYPLSTFPYLVKALVRTHKYMHRHQIFLIVYTHGTTFSKWTSYSSFPDCLYTQDYIRHLDELFELF